jgi:hypothetical protein
METKIIRYFASFKAIAPRARILKLHSFKIDAPDTDNDIFLPLNIKQQIILKASQFKALKSINISAYPVTIKKESDGFLVETFELFHPRKKHFTIDQKELCL